MTDSAIPFKAALAPVVSTPAPSPTAGSSSRRPLSLEVAKALVEAALAMLHQTAGGRQKDSSYLALLAAARDQHMEVALAEFEAKLPVQAVRNGGGVVDKLAGEEGA